MIPGSHDGSRESGLTPQVPHLQSIIHPHQQPSTHASDEPPTAQTFSEFPSQSNQAKSDSFRCQLCDRSYERADHLNRHLRNHENLRPHQCPECPKRFNRADLLRRHRSSHDRPSTGRPRGDFLRPRGSGRERVVAACLACVASKSKCQDEKPCIRCQRRQIECESSSDTATTQQHSRQPTTVANSNDFDDSNHGHLILPPQYVSDKMPQLNLPATNNLHQTFDPFDDFQVPYVDGGLQLNQGLSFMPRDAYLGQDMDFEVWGIDPECIELAYQDFERDQLDRRPARPAETDQASASKIVSRRSAAFERSTWIWAPTQNDQAMNDQNNLQLDEESIPSILTPSSPAIDADEFASCFTTAEKRDQVLGILYTIRRDATQFPSLPSLKLLNKIIQVYFVTSTYWIDHMVHAPSFDGAKALSQLLLAIIAAGCTLISVPAVSKMGLALQEVVRHTVGEFWEQNNSNTRNLQSLQAFVIGLDIGLWSGFKRKMEIAESFGQPVVAMLRRAGVFAASRLPSSSSPLMSDSEAVVDSKWRNWVERESFKRLALHVFTHDVFASVGLQKPPLILFTELKFELPASEDLWLAKSALKWREKYLASEASDHNIPSFMEALQNLGHLTKHSQRINVHLSSLIILHGFWGQIHGLLDAKKYYSRASPTHQLSVLATGNELYRDLSRFAARLPQLTNNSPDAILLSELFLMIFHANLEDLQRFAGRFGEGEAVEATEEFRKWAKTMEARIAVWHAAQVIRAANNLVPNALMAFNAIAVYYATLTLWIYGLMAPHSASWTETQNQQFQLPIHSSNLEIVLNEEDGPESRAFRENEKGVPGIVAFGSDSREFIPLKAADRILQFARQLYWGNYPIEEQPLPPLVEGLCDLLKELESLPASHMSRAQSESAR
ncbi:hypothetical protein DL98DRAFT_460770 [Cadophora sp. DSE1049]|nr:hypothetical protein DL98DRAFT_460770 [Cadophora sp. DSE1049]